LETKLKLKTIVTKLQLDDEEEESNGRYASIYIVWST